MASTPIRKPPADTRLFSAFMACALPTSPTGVMDVPMADSAGRTRSSVAAGPPNMMDSSPVRARGTPPDTGASTICPPASATAWASRWVWAGTPELISTTTLPARRPASTPSAPLSTCSTMPLVGSMVTMMSLCAASAAQVAAACPPTSCANLSAWPGTASNTVTAKPACTSRAAIGQPMLPMPISPTRSCAALMLAAP
ncbi:hypothetical protein D3C72_1749180 [compost metagenome]